MTCLQADLEDQILKMLSSATGSLLDNIELINALDASKATFEAVTQSLMVGFCPSDRLKKHAMNSSSLCYSTMHLVPFGC